ncbi:hypothetical protein ACH5RR_024165 [Cinchona calisaya]|uniref:Uncharacterized protein n=1 Tax=Cinchona calisaya TaxID=153742 RepID=A0ABD2ZHR5_9GENT
MKQSQAPISHHDERKKEKEDDHDQSTIPRIWDCGSPLYDSYELVSLSHLIDRHIMILPSLSGSRQERMISSRFSHAPADHEEAPASKKARGSSVLVTFWWKIMEKKALKRRNCGEREEHKPKKMMINSGICRVYNRISSLRK